ncbi:hypothetical protein EJ06DRAFT_316374 [Trichodelitschia bisporula]|uniref:Uncharacterized protein n=1 Tax=Trichodelitschia bisporula TaxID=703511 RepID=A0A6G1I3Z6_9PEZI|nr:hypothetical protein EJ06DRAFT_316374 [Trichodelitschia bisporula]
MDYSFNLEHPRPDSPTLGGQRYSVRLVHAPPSHPVSPLTFRSSLQSPLQPPFLHLQTIDEVLDSTTDSWAAGSLFDELDMVTSLDPEPDCDFTTSNVGLGLSVDSCRHASDIVDTRRPNTRPEDVLAYLRAAVPTTPPAHPSPIDSATNPLQHPNSAPLYEDNYSTCYGLYCWPPGRHGRDCGIPRSFSHRSRSDSAIAEQNCDSDPELHVETMTWAATVSESSSDWSSVTSDGDDRMWANMGDDDGVLRDLEMISDTGSPVSIEMFLELEAEGVIQWGGELEAVREVSPTPSCESEDWMLFLERKSLDSDPWNGLHLFTDEGPAMQPSGAGHA